MADSGLRNTVSWGVNLGAVGIAIVALGWSVVKTEDRYYASQAAADNALVSQRIDYAEREIEQLRADLRALDAEHPPRDLLERIERIEQQLNP